MLTSSGVSPCSSFFLDRVEFITIDLCWAAGWIFTPRIASRNEMSSGTIIEWSASFLSRTYIFSLFEYCICSWDFFFGCQPTSLFPSFAASLFIYLVLHFYEAYKTRQRKKPNYNESKLNDSSKYFRAWYLVYIQLEGSAYCFPS